MRFHFWSTLFILFLCLSVQLFESRAVKRRSKRGLWDTVKKGWTHTKNWLSDTFGSGGDVDVPGFFKQSLDSAKEDMGDFLSELKNTLEDSVDFLEEEISEKWNELAPEIKDELTHMFNHLKQYGSEAFKRMSQSPECIGECALSLLACVPACSQESVSCITCLGARVTDVCLDCFEDKPRNATMDARCL